MNLSKVLQGLGFRDVEARVYLAILELGEATASEIAKKTKLKRPSVYVILKDLIRQGQVSSYIRKKVTRFISQSPESVVAHARERLHQVEISLPEFQALHKAGEKSGKPRIRYFEGVEGLITVMEESIAGNDKTILVWADLDLSKKTFGDYYTDYTKMRVERNISVRAILEDNKVARAFKEKSVSEKAEARIIPAVNYDFNDEIQIYDDKVAIISHHDQIGVIVENQAIANTQRAIFRLGWERAGEIDVSRV